MRNLVALFCLIAHTALAGLFSDSVAFKGASIPNLAPALPGLDIPAEAFYDFENGTIGNLITVAGMSSDVHGSYYDLFRDNHSDGSSAFAGTYIVAQANTLPFPINVNGVEYTGTGSRGICLSNYPVGESFSQHPFLNWKKMAVGYWVTYNASNDLSINFDSVGETSVGGSPGFGVMEQQVTPSINALVAHGDNGTGGAVGGTITLTKGHRYWASWLIDLTVQTNYVTLFDPSSGMAQVGASQIKTTGSAINTFDLTAGSLFTNNNTLIDNVIIAFDDDAVTNFGTWQPTTLTNRDVYSNLTGRYRMGEGSGATTVNDATAGTDLSFVSTTWTTGDNGKPAVAFDGSSGYLQGGAQYNFTTLGWSFTARVHPAALPGTGSFGTIVSTIDSGFTSGYWVAIDHSGFVNFNTFQAGGGQGAVSSSPLVAGNTYDICGVLHANGSVNIYIQGLDATGAVTTHIAPDSSTGHFIVGATDGSPKTFFFNGWMQETPRIYNSELTAAEALRIHNRAP